jgi:uncharacterized protein with FMN-binding domain
LSVLIFVFVALFVAVNKAPAATIEFLSGAKLQCTVLAKDDKTVTVETVISGRTLTQKYLLSSIHAVTIGEKHYLINEKSTTSAVTGSSPATRTSTASGQSTLPATGAAAKLRTRAEIDALIEQVGRTPPDWYESTPLNYPPALDLSWPEKAEGAWNNQKNVGQYIWDVMNPNPSKWREGIRLLHHLLVVNKDSPQTQVRVMQSLGTKYHDLLEDYARAAFWYRKAGVERSPTSAPGDTVRLAECFWRLGNRQMAVELLNKTTPNVAMIKLWADLGETDKALQLCEAVVRGGRPEVAYMYAGDACRIVGRYPQALAYYQKVLDVPAAGQFKTRIEREHGRARSSIEAIQLFELSDVRKVADGSYTASSLGYEGQIQVNVVVSSGRIEAVKVTQHREKQFYSALTDTPAKIIAKQGVKGVDATTSATITSEAIINATAKALASGAK